jgi:hypothetical protein
VKRRQSVCEECGGLKRWDPRFPRCLSCHLTRLVEIKHEAKRGRVEDYTELRSWGLTREQATARMGLSERSGFRYERLLRAQDQSSAPNEVSRGT